MNKSFLNYPRLITLVLIALSSNTLLAQISHVPNATWEAQFDKQLKTNEFLEDWVSSDPSRDVFYEKWKTLLVKPPKTDESLSDQESAIIDRMISKAKLDKQPKTSEVLIRWPSNDPSSDIANEEWNAQWDKQPKAKEWFRNWRSTIQSSDFNLNREQDLAKKYLLNLPGYVRKPSETEVLELNKILKDNQLNDLEAWRNMGSYLNRNFMEQRNPVWNPAIYTGAGPAHLMAINHQGSSSGNGGPSNKKITDLEKQIIAQRYQIKLLTHSVLEILSKLENMEKNQ